MKLKISIVLGTALAFHQLVYTPGDYNLVPLLVQSLGRYERVGPLVSLLVRFNMFEGRTGVSRYECLGQTFSNRVGLGPNCDLDGALARQFLRLGYGFVTVGSMGKLPTT
jgi:hypothetical protein